MRNEFVALLAVLAASGRALSAHAQEAGSIDSIFARYASRESPGCAVAVSRAGEIILARGYGMANLEHGVAITPASIFHVASLSKQFTAFAIALLATEGALSLDDDIRTHLPEVPDFGPRITIRQLLHHTSGLRDQWELLSYAGWRPDDPKTQADILWLVGRQRELNFPPGDQVLYSNTGYTLLAEIVARASGRSFRAFTDERIFRPLGMNSTHFHDDHAMIVTGRTAAYVSRDAGYAISIPVFDNAGATSLFTTVEDLVRWDRNFHLPVVGAAAVELLHSRGRLNDGTELPYALGLVVSDWRGLRTVGHGGADAGYRADLLRFPDHRLTFITLCNTVANAGQLNRSLAQVFLAGHLAEVPPAGSGNTARPSRLSEERRRLLDGRYWDDRFETLLTISAADSGLTARGLGPLESLGESRFRISAPELTLDFSDDASRVESVRDDGARRSYRRVPPAAGGVSPYAGTFYSPELDAFWEVGAGENGLVVRRRRFADRQADPLFLDAFSSGGMILRFTRDAAGRVDGFLLTGGRVRHLRFAKTTWPPA